MIPTNKTWLRLLASMLLLLPVTALTACGVNHGEGIEETPVMEPTTGVHGDYTPARGPRDMSDRSSAVVRGTTGQPHDGRIWGASPEDPGAITSIVVPIEVRSVEAASIAMKEGQTVHLELFSSAGPARESIMEGLAEREGLFYLRRMPDRMSPYTEIVDPKAGRPDGEPIYQPASPEGVLITSQDGVWSVDTGESFPSASLADFYPDEQTFPEPKRPSG